jgi:hypothetical protein
MRQKNQQYQISHKKKSKIDQRMICITMCFRSHLTLVFPNNALELFLEKTVNFILQ